jgi:hypothetical protein
LRSLTDHEKHNLGPYIPKQDLDNADFHDGEVPWWLFKENRCVTIGNDIYCRLGEYNPCSPEGLALLGHELFHVGQYRNGMTVLSYIIEDGLSEGGRKNPLEIPAYLLQDQIENDLYNRYPNANACECAK